MSVNKCLVLCFSMCFVDLEEPGMLKKALALSGTEFKGSSLQVQKADEKKEEAKPEKKQDKKKDKGKKKGTLTICSV